MKKTILTLGVLALACGAPALPGQEDPHSLVVKMAANETNSAATDHRAFSFLRSKKEHAETLTYYVVETTEGEATKLLLVNGASPDPGHQAVADREMDNLLRNANARQTRLKHDKEDADLARNMLQLLPDAFVYRFEGDDGGLIKLGFTPNPAFHPPSKVANVFHAMAGTLEIDAKQLRLVRFQGSLIDDVDFGWGILGHLKKGGSFDVVQSEVASGHWTITKLSVQIEGRALLFKGIDVHDELQMSDFHAIPEDLRFEQGFALSRQADSSTVLAALSGRN